MKSIKQILGSVLFLIAAFSFTSFDAEAQQIDGKKIVQENSQSICKVLLWDPVFGQVVEEWGLDAETALEYSYMGRGSGFFVTKSGYLFTNRHVAEQCIHGWALLDYTLDGESYEYQTLTYFSGLENDPAVDKIHYSGFAIPLIQVFTGNGPNDFTLYLGECVSIGSSFDGAMIKVVSDMDGNPVGDIFTPVQISNSDEAIMGESICVYGFPAQYGDATFNQNVMDRATLTFGVHAGLDYVFDPDWSMIKTDADINGGNSGGPAFGEDYKVVGIATAKGNKTNIGLLGGINGMYHVAQADPVAFNELKKRGLTEPSYQPDDMAKKTVYTQEDMPDLPLDLSVSSNDNSTTNSGLITISGVVKSGDTGGPIAGATVGLITYQGDEAVVASSAVTNSKGEFVLAPDVQPGTYVFAALADGYEDVIVEQAFNQTEAFTVTMVKSR